MGAKERWLPFPGYAGWYEISELGRARSLPRTTTPGKLLKAQLGGTGYRQFALSKYGRVRVFLAGRMVLTAFDRPCPPGKRARHGPGGKADDCLANLRWG